MLPQRELNGERKVDFVMVSDFREEMEAHLGRFLKQMKERNKRVGLVQMGVYDLKAKQQIHPSVREYIDGHNIQMLVYGESINCDILLVNQPGIFSEEQKYIPEVTAKAIHVIVTQTPKDAKVKYGLRHCARKIERYGKTIRSTWYPLNHEVRENLLENHLRELRSIRLSKNNWFKDDLTETAIADYIEDWQTEQNQYQLANRGMMMTNEQNKETTYAPVKDEQTSSVTQEFIEELIKREAEANKLEAEIQAYEKKIKQMKNSNSLEENKEGKKVYL